jgi:hypothetical protein
MSPDMTASVELDCANPMCGMSIHVGDPITLGEFGWTHPVCALEYQVDVAAERQHDGRREAR